MVQYNISESVRNYRICLWKNFCFIGHGVSSNYFLSRESSEYLWVIDNKFGKCYSDINLFCRICLLWIIVWSVADH